MNNQIYPAKPKIKVACTILAMYICCLFFDGVHYNINISQLNTVKNNWQ